MSETDTTVALQQEALGLAELGEITQHRAKKIAAAHGISFHALLKLGALLLVLVRMARGIISGEPVSQSFSLFGIRWRVTLQREAT